MVQVPLAPGAIGAISADEVAHHQVPLAPGAIGAISAMRLEAGKKHH